LIPAKAASDYNIYCFTTSNDIARIRSGMLLGQYQLASASLPQDVALTPMLNRQRLAITQQGFTVNLPSRCCSAYRHHAVKPERALLSNRFSRNRHFASSIMIVILI
jgi:hypothetical protein